ncbi:MAG: hypothetical protein WD294_11530 [Phycisphaeraceae bacterium]
MPVYLFTYHGYGTWLPDRQPGFVHYRQGLQARSKDMAGAYRQQQTSSKAVFDGAAQQVIVRTVREAALHLEATLHAVSADTTHVHLLISWKHGRGWRAMRTSVKSALTRALNAQIATRAWFSKGASRKRIRDRSHFDYLMHRYLPRHKGKRWFRPSVQ